MQRRQGRKKHSNFRKMGVSLPGAWGGGEHNTNPRKVRGFS